MDFKKSFDAAYLEFKKVPMDSLYQSFVGFVSRLRVKKILNEIKGKNRIILDIGCEAGYISIKIAEKQHFVIPLDICKPALIKFKEKLLKMDIKLTPLLGTIHNLPIKDNSVDYIICSEVIEHLPNVDTCLREMKRVLKPEGKLILTFPNETLRKFFYPILKLFNIDTSIEKKVTLFSYSKKEIINKCKNHLRIIKHFSLFWFLPLTRFIIAQK